MTSGVSKDNLWSALKLFTLKNVMTGPLEELHYKESFSSVLFFQASRLHDPGNFQSLTSKMQLIDSSRVWNNSVYWKLQTPLPRPAFLCLDIYWPIVFCQIRSRVKVARKNFFEILLLNFLEVYQTCEVFFKGFSVSIGKFKSQLIFMPVLSSSSF